MRQSATLTIAPPPPALLSAPTPDVEPLRTAEELEAEELRLLAMAVGDHLPPEIQARVQRLRRRRAALERVGG